MKYQLFKLTLFVGFLFSNSLSLSAQTRQDQFIGSVVELNKDSQGKYSASIISHLVHEGRVKQPTQGDKIKEDASEFVLINYTDQAGNVIKEFSFFQPFLAHYEYVNDEGQLEHADVPEETISYLLRFPNDPLIANIQVLIASKDGQTELINEALK